METSPRGTSFSTVVITSSWLTLASPSAKENIRNPARPRASHGCSRSGIIEVSGTLLGGPSTPSIVLEDNAVRGHLARFIREVTVVASQLGQGVENVSGAR